MSTKDTIAQRLVLKTIQQYTASTIVVTVLPPIQDAIYKGEERLFPIRYTIAGALYSAEKRAVLGSFIRHQDLRPYTRTSVIDLWVLPLVIVVVISIFLIVFRTIYHKYKFKKEHIQQFGAVGSGEDEYLDLFTFETVQDTDQVVVINEEIMLLRSWKRVLQLPEDDETKGKFEAFFKTSKTDTFFSPETKLLTRLNQLWYACMAMSLGWFLYQGAHSLLPISTVSAIVDTTTLQIASIFVDNLLFAVIIGFTYEITMTFCSQWLADKKVRIKKILLSGVQRALIVTVLFAFYTIVTLFLYIPYFSYCLGWMVLSIAFVWPLSLRKIHTKLLVQACGIGLSIAIISSVFVTPWGMAKVGTTLATYIGSILLGTSSVIILQMNPKTVYTQLKNKILDYCFWVPQEEHLQALYTPEEDSVQMNPRTATVAADA